MDNMKDNIINFERGLITIKLISSSTGLVLNLRINTSYDRVKEKA